MAEQAERIVARDLMMEDVAQLHDDLTLGEAMRALVDLQADPKRPNVLAILDSEGHYLGIVTARLLFTSLLTLWMPGKNVREDDGLLQDELLAVVEDRAEVKVHDALVRGLPTAASGDRLLDLIELGCDKRLEFIPVVEGDHLVGVVPVTAIFDAAAGLALTPEHEGIRMDDEPAGPRH